MMSKASWTMLFTAGVLAVTAALNMVPAQVSAAGLAAQELPEGPGKAELRRVCAGCHDLMFAASTRETEEGWTKIVNDMRSKGADGSEEDFQKIIAYLTAHMGKPPVR